MVLRLVIYSGFVGGLPEGSDKVSIGKAISSTQTYLDELKLQLNRAENSHLQRFLTQVFFVDNGATKMIELFPEPNWTVLKMKRSVLDSFGLLAGSKSKPDKHFIFTYLNGWTPIEKEMDNNRLQIVNFFGQNGFRVFLRHRGVQQVSQPASSSATPAGYVSTEVVEQNEPHNIFGEEMTFVVRVWDFRYGREGDVVGSTTITIEIERSGMTLCVDLVGKLREDGYITDDDFHATVFFGDTPLVGFDAMQPLSYFGIGRGSVLDVKLYSNEIEDDFVEIENHFVSGDEVDITDYIPIDQSYLDDPSDFFEKEDVKLETKEEPKTIWVSVNELKGRNLMLFRFINPEISTNDLKHKIVEEARRRAENIGQKKHLGFDDFKLLSDGAVMVSDDSIGDYLDNKMQKKLDVEVYLTLRGGGKLGVRKSIQKTNKSEEYKNFALETSKGVNEVVKKSVLHTLQSTKDMEVRFGKFLEMSASNPVSALKYLADQMTEEALTETLSEMSNLGGTTEFKLKVIAKKIYGTPMTELLNIGEGIGGIVEASEMALCSCFF